jgi:hypothetical protein
VQLESACRDLYGDDRGSILTIFEKRHKGAGNWFDDFDQRRIDIGATTNSSVPVEDRMKEALATSASTDEEKFWKSLLVGYVTRNYTAHQTIVDEFLAIKHFEDAVGHIVNALHWLPNYK